MIKWYASVTNGNFKGGKMLEALFMPIKIHLKVTGQQYQKFHIIFNFFKFLKNFDSEFSDSSIHVPVLTFINICIH